MNTLCICYYSKKLYLNLINLKSSNAINKINTNINKNFVKLTVKQKVKLSVKPSAYTNSISNKSKPAKK